MAIRKIRSLMRDYDLVSSDNTIYIGKDVDGEMFLFDIMENYKCTGKAKFVANSTKAKLDAILTKQVSMNYYWLNGGEKNIGQIKAKFGGVTNETTNEVQNDVEEVKNNVAGISEMLVAMQKQNELMQLQMERQAEKEKVTLELLQSLIPQKIEVVKDEKIVSNVEGKTHKEFENILKLVDIKIPVMLTGPAGSGKNHTLEQVADALNLDFYFTNAVTQEFKLTGFIDASGTYQETQFYKAFKNGGLFFLDEMDASTPDALIILNSALANGYFDFPTGRVDAHEDFRVVSAGNTYGTGADMQYVGRNVLDGATLDRFVVIEFDYDKDVEKAIAGNDEITEFVQELREIYSRNQIRSILSMRATTNIKKMEKAGLDVEFIIKTAVVKGMATDDLHTIKYDVENRRSNKYMAGLLKLIKSA